MRIRGLEVGVAAVGLLLSAPAGGWADGEQAPDPYEAALARAEAIETRVIEALAEVRPSSVSVLMKVRDKRDGSLRLAGCGSGVIVFFDQKTWILTNDHVAAPADELEVVTLDGQHHDVELVDSLALYDVALLRFSGKVPAISKGAKILPKSARDLAEGQFVVATGNPFFLAMDGRSVATFGVVSGTDRVLGSAQTHLYAGAIQHDAAVNPGNSGGPLWNLKGELVGINGMIASRGAGGVGAANTGASFSIPMDQIQPHLSRMKDSRRDAQAGYLGVETETSVDAKGNPNGARVVRVDGRGPARMMEGDVITSLRVGPKSTTIRTSTDLLGALTTCPAGTVVRVFFRRAGKPESWSGTLGSAK